MERTTIVTANDGELDIMITRDFDLTCEELFSAYVEAELIEQWMGTKVLEWEARQMGHYRIQTHDPKGNLAFEASGVIHDLITNERMVRTFEMHNTGLGVQLEFYRFEEFSPEQSRLHMHVLYETVEQRDRVLSMGYRMGIGMAHDRIQNIFSQQSKHS